MKPTLYDVRVDPILSNLALAYQNDEYIANLIAPVISTKKLTGKYFQYDTSKFRKTKSIRGMGATTNEVGYGVAQSTAFVCVEHSLKQIAPDELKDQADQPLSPEIDAMENVKERLLIEKEDDLATYMASTTNLTNNTTLSGTSQWSDYAASDPIGDIETGIETVHSKIFKRPNTLVLGIQVWNKLKHHPDLIDRIKYAGLGKMSTQALADLLDISRVIIGAAGKETAKEGQTSSLSYIWGKYAWLLYVEPTPRVKSISFAYHFHYKNPLSVDKWYDTDRKGTWVRVGETYVRETVSVDAAYFIKDAVA